MVEIPVNMYVYIGRYICKGVEQIPQFNFFVFVCLFIAKERVLFGRFEYTILSITLLKNHPTSFSCQVDQIKSPFLYQRPLKGGNVMKNKQGLCKVKGI